MDFFIRLYIIEIVSKDTKISGEKLIKKKKWYGKGTGVGKKSYICGVNEKLFYMPTIIHHYTNIDVLALILKNRTLRFNRLDQVDDPEESNFVSNGVNIGLYAFVSCWTEEKEESIPMWKMYTNKNWGVRLSFEKEGLFKTYTDVESYRYNGLVGTNLGAPIRFLFPTEVRWEQTSYMPPFLTEEYDKCHFYRKIEYVDDLKPYANDTVRITQQPDNNVSLKIQTDKVGSYKNKRWAFQEESRFLLFFLPGNPTALFNTPNFIEYQSRFMADIIHNKGLGFSYYDMHLSDKAFDNLVITMSPLCDDAQIAIVEALRDKYAPKAEIRKSNLAGKIVK